MLLQESHSIFVFLAFGSALIVMPILFLLSKRKFRKNGVQVDAVVIKTVGRQVGAVRGTFFPVFAYEADGVRQEVEHKIGNPNKPKYKDGETVAIIYSKDDVRKLQIVNDKFPLMISAASILSGLTILVILLVQTFWL